MWGTLFCQGLMIIAITLSLTFSTVAQESKPAPQSSSATPAVSSDAMVSSGDAKMQKKDSDGAIADYSRAIELDPKLAAAYVNRAVVQNQLGHVNEAQQDLAKAKQLDPSLQITLPTATNSTPVDASSYLTAAVNKAIKGDYDGAIAD